MHLLYHKYTSIDHLIYYIDPKWFKFTALVLVDFYRKGTMSANFIRIQCPSLRSGPNLKFVDLVLAVP